MARQQAHLNVHEQAAPAALVGRSCTAPVGQHLRIAVDKVLRELSVTPEPDVVALRVLDDMLVAGLAWAAATGDTCRIHPAVRAVRVAREQLRTDPAAARSALLAARDGLHDGAPRQ